MKSAHQSSVHAVARALPTLLESRVRSSELLQQISELVDGFVSLSAPNRRSSVEQSLSNEWKLLGVNEALNVVRGAQSGLPS